MPALSDYRLFPPLNRTPTSAFGFNLEYQIGATGTFAQLAGKSYTTVPTPTASASLVVTSFNLTALELRPLNDQSGPVTLRLNNIATTGTTLNTVALDNFSYSAVAIPEPATYALAGGAGVLALAIIRGRRRRSEG